MALASRFIKGREDGKMEARDADRWRPDRHQYGQGCLMYPSTAPENQTTIVFDFAQADRLCTVVVKEAPAQIHQTLDEYST